MLFAIEEQKDFCNGNLKKIGYKLKKTGFANSKRRQRAKQFSRIICNWFSKNCNTFFDKMNQFML